MRGASTGPSDPWTSESLENIVADLELIRTNCAAGASRHQLRHVSSQIREFSNGRLLEAWRKVGLVKQPNILAWRFTGKGIAKNSIAIAGGATDLPIEEAEPVPDGKFLFNTIHLKIVNKAWTLVSHSTPWIVKHDDGALLSTIHEDPFVEESMPLTEFFKGCAIYYRGIKISRAEIVRHIAHGRDGVHYGKERSRDKQKSDALDALASGLVDKRDSVFFAYFAIAQALAGAPDIDVFLEAAKRRIA